MKELIVILLLILIIFYQESCREYFTTEKIKSKIDGRFYKVLNYDDKSNAADIVAELNNFTLQLIKKLKKEYLEQDNITREGIKGREIAERLFSRYNPRSLQENEPVRMDRTSYVKNKGDVIGLCLRERKNKSFHDMDTLKFVMLHELAHIVTPELEHTPLYWTNFKFLLEFSEKHGLYKSPRYDLNNENYCGVLVNYNPIYDDKLASYFAAGL